MIILDPFDELAEDIADIGHFMKCILKSVMYLFLGAIPVTIIAIIMQNFIKPLIFALCAFFAVSCASQSPVTAKSKVIAQPSAIKAVRTTAYSHTENDHKRYSNKSAVGSKLVYNSQRNSAAADWSVFPVGTQFRVKGYPKIYVIDDYGSALIGTKTIDIYRPNQKMMRNWGVRYVDIEIVKWGCYKESRAIIQDRKKYAHIRAMDRELQKKELTNRG
jgi:3D (Asp-Asp-Asp) domain-containing protein